MSHVTATLTQYRDRRALHIKFPHALPHHKHLLNSTIVLTKAQRDDITDYDRRYEVVQCTETELLCVPRGWGDLSQEMTQDIWNVFEVDPLPITGWRWTKALRTFLEYNHDEVFIDLIANTTLSSQTRAAFNMLFTTLKPDQEAVLNEIAAEHNLDPSQKVGMFRTFTRRLTLIQGPPGTGKTTTAVALVDLLAQFHDRVLVTGPTHVAVDAQLSRAIQLTEHLLRRTRQESRLSARCEERVRRVTLDAIAEREMEQRLDAAYMKSESAKKERLKIATMGHKKPK